MPETLTIRTELAGEIVAPALKSLGVAGKSGILTVSSPPAGSAPPTVRTISLRAGKPVFATSNNPDERFNGVLIRHELVSLSDLMRAVEQMLRDSLRLGEVLSREEILDPPRVAQALHLQFQEIICRALVVCAGNFNFSEQPVSASDDVGFRVPVNALIRQALQGVTGLHRVLAEIGGTDAVFAASERFDLEAATAELSADETRDLSIFREPKGLIHLCAEASLADFHVCSLVWILLTIGALTRLE